MPVLQNVALIFSPDFYFPLFPPFSLLALLVVVGHYLEIVIAKDKKLQLNFTMSF